jgi:hypothetical protein
MRGLLSILAAVVVAPGVLASGVVAEGSASGSLVVSGRKTPMKHSYAVDRGGHVELVLSSASLSDGAFSSNSVMPDGASVVIIKLDETRDADETYFFTPGLPPDISVREVVRVKLKESTARRVAGTAVMDDPGFSWSFDVRFDAPVSTLVTFKTRVSENASPAEKAMAELEARAIRLDRSRFRSAVIDGDAEVVKLMLDAGLGSDLNEALGTAIDVESPDTVRVLIAAGADVNALGPYGQSMTLHAASMGNVEVVKALIAAGADVNVENEYGVAPLAAAAEQGHLDCVKELLDAGANVNARNPYGGTAIQVAVLRGYKEIVRLLIDAGADVKRDEKELLSLTEDEEIRDMIRRAAR